MAEGGKWTFPVVPRSGPLLSLNELSREHLISHLPLNPSTSITCALQSYMVCPCRKQRIPANHTAKTPSWLTGHGEADIHKAYQRVMVVNGISAFLCCKELLHPMNVSRLLIAAFSGEGFLAEERKGVASFDKGWRQLWTFFPSHLS